MILESSHWGFSCCSTGSPIVTVGYVDANSLAIRGLQLGWNIWIYNSGFSPLNVWIHGEHLSNWRLRLPDSSRRTVWEGTKSNRMDEPMVHTKQIDKLRYKETENGVCFLRNCSTPLDFWTIHQECWAMLGEFPKKEAWMELRGISAFSTWEIHVDVAKIRPPT